ncbi:hypothetical protein BJX76DRAFT_123831 [Aspergillus varians]
MKFMLCNVSCEMQLGWFLPAILGEKLQPRLVLCLSEVRSIIESFKVEQHVSAIGTPNLEAQGKLNPHLPSKATLIPDFSSNLQVNGEEVMGKKVLSFRQDFYALPALSLLPAI